MTEWCFNALPGPGRMPTLDVLPVHVSSRQVVISDEKCCYSGVLAILLMHIADSEEAAEVAPSGAPDELVGTDVSIATQVTCANDDAKCPPVSDFWASRRAHNCGGRTITNRIPCCSEVSAQVLFPVLHPGFVTVTHGHGFTTRQAAEGFSGSRRVSGRPRTPQHGRRSGRAARRRSDRQAGTSRRFDPAWHRATGTGRAGSHR
jgi:hypothetical protein